LTNENFRALIRLTKSQFDADVISAPTLTALEVWFLACILLLLLTFVELGIVIQMTKVEQGSVCGCLIYKKVRT